MDPIARNKLEEIRQSRKDKLIVILNKSNYEPQKLKNDKGVQVAEYCIKCDHLILVSDTEHCMDCDICVTGYDHHCAFFGKCIGKGNLCCFYATLFLFYVNIFILLAALGGIFNYVDKKKKK